MFNPQYEQSQIAGVLAPAEQAAQRANVAQEAGFAGAGQLGSARDALAAQQTQNINTQTLGSLAAQTQAGIQQQQAQAAGSLLTGGLQGLNQAGSNYGNLLQTGTSLAGQAGQNYGNLLNAGNTAQGQAGQNYGNLLNAGNTAQGQGISGYGALTGAGTTNVGAAPGTIGSTLGYASAPLSNYGQYASLLFGAPQQTPNYAGTQGQTQSGSSKGGGLSFSDIRLKTIINNLNYGLNEILKINPISWFWKNKEILGDKKEIGFSAQEMQKIIPEIVYTENEILKIDYSKLTAVLTIAVQQQQLQIDQINQKIKEREFA